MLRANAKPCSPLSLSLSPSLSRAQALGAILRAWAIRLFWCPNHIQAPLQSTADSLFEAVPDFGGYLLKIGSEKQGAHPSAPEPIALARSRARALRP